MGKNRLELRRMAEAAEKQEKTSSGTTARKTTKKRKATKRKTTTRKTKEKGIQRKRMVWCVFNGSMKEEGRFPYDQKEAAEAKLEQLRSKSKKMFFMQPVKEAMGDVTPITIESAPEEDEPKVKKDASAEVADDDAENDSDEESEEVDDSDG